MAKEEIDLGTLLFTINALKAKKEYDRVEGKAEHLFKKLNKYERQVLKTALEGNEFRKFFQKELGGIANEMIKFLIP